MKIDDAIRIVTTCAIDYHSNLVDKNLLFVFGSAQAPRFMECYFAPAHYLHLTGIIYNSSSSHFYEQCLNNRLSASSIGLKGDGSTEMKLKVLPQLVQIHKKTTMIGDYDGSKTLLYTEKLVGNITACLGFIQVDGYFVPNTALKQDIRDIAKPMHRALAVFRKDRKALQYEELCYKAKGIEVAHEKIQNAIINRSFSN